VEDRRARLAGDRRRFADFARLWRIAGV